MNQLIPKLVQLALGFLLIVPLTACALSGKVIEGQVLEAGTNKPIAGAIVIARWDKTYSSLADTTTVCIHVESAISDEQGRFRLPTWRGKAPSWGTSIYKSGYERSPQRPGPGAGEYDYVLRPFAGGREERLKYLLHLSSLVGCYGAGDEKSLVPVYKAFYDEARGIATSDKEKDMLQAIRRRALYAWSRPSRELTTHEIEQAIQNDPYLREQFK